MRIRSQGKQVQVYFSTSYSFPIKSLIINDTLIETYYMTGKSSKSDAAE